MKLAIVSGTSIHRSQVFAGWTELEIETPYGSVEAKRRGDVLALNRHGFAKPLPPHSINYRANAAAVQVFGAQSAVTLNSVGSLDPALPPGSLVSCTDYMSFAPKTFIDDRMSVFAPVIANPLLDRIVEVAKEPIALGKVYAQTPGPRFETRAEVRALRLLGADVVGMTLANEADLLLELGIEITAFCMVDNYAHGVMELPLSAEVFAVLVKENQQKVDAFLRAVTALG